MQDLNRTENNRNRDLLEVVLQNKEEQRNAAIETAQRITATLHTTNGNLSRPSSFISKRSTTLSQSQERLSNEEQSMVLPDIKKTPQLVQSSIVSLGLLCIVSVILCAVALQILFFIADNPSTGKTGKQRNYFIHFF